MSAFLAGGCLAPRRRRVRGAFRRRRVAGLYEGEGGAEEFRGAPGPLDAAPAGAPLQDHPGAPDAASWGSERGVEPLGGGGVVAGSDMKPHDSGLLRLVESESRERERELTRFGLKGTEREATRLLKGIQRETQFSFYGEMGFLAKFRPLP